MSKNYKQLNKMVTASRDALHKAYDIGYEQAKKDYKRPYTHLTPEVCEGGVQFRCKQCNRLMIAYYMYCPYCGSLVKEADNDNRNT